MKLEKAIEGNYKVLKVFDARLEETEKEALKLCIEAGNRIIAWRNDNDDDLLWDLPGETED